MFHVLLQVHVTTLTPRAATALLPAGGITSHRVGGARATRARYINANPELDLFRKGYVTAKTNWLAPVYPLNNLETSQTLQTRRGIRTQCAFDCQTQYPAPEPALVC